MGYNHPQESLEMTGPPPTILVPQVDPKAVAAVAVEQEVVSPKSTAKPLSQIFGGIQKIIQSGILLVKIFKKIGKNPQILGDVPYFIWVDGGGLCMFAVFFAVGKDGKQLKTSMKSPWKEGVEYQEFLGRKFVVLLRATPDRTSISMPCKLLLCSPIGGVLNPQKMMGCL